MLNSLKPYTSRIISRANGKRPHNLNHKRFIKNFKLLKEAY